MKDTRMMSTRAELMKDTRMMSTRAELMKDTRMTSDTIAAATAASLSE